MPREETNAETEIRQNSAMIKIPNVATKNSEQANVSESRKAKIEARAG